MTSLGVRRAFGVGAAVAASLAVSACSTVIKTSAAESPIDAADRQALIAAAAEVASSPWPKPSSSSLADRLAGEAGEKISRDDAIEAYLVKIGESADPERAIMSDASRHLSAAAALKSAADSACEAENPRLSDVALLEDAIGDLRETRSIYVSALKKIDGDDAVIDQLKTDFDDAIKDLGVAADRLAASAMKRRAHNYAGSKEAAALGAGGR
ncbi:MAG TPA: hypothetical protein PKM48_08275 [Parvularculaceae bacterium]|nr:hypothetical protein [Parvularculaceae bacterium]